MRHRLVSSASTSVPSPLGASTSRMPPGSLPARLASRGGASQAQCTTPASGPSSLRTSARKRADRVAVGQRARVGSRSGHRRAPVRSGPATTAASCAAQPGAVPGMPGRQRPSAHDRQLARSPAGQVRRDQRAEATGAPGDQVDPVGDRPARRVQAGGVQSTSCGAYLTPARRQVSPPGAGVWPGSGQLPGQRRGLIRRQVGVQHAALGTGILGRQRPDEPGQPSAADVRRRPRRVEQPLGDLQGRAAPEAGRSAPAGQSPAAGSTGRRRVRRRGRRRTRTGRWTPPTRPREVAQVRGHIGVERQQGGRAQPAGQGRGKLPLVGPVQAEQHAVRGGERRRGRSGCPPAGQQPGGAGRVGGAVESAGHGNPGQDGGRGRGGGRPAADAGERVSGELDHVPPGQVQG